MIGIFGGTFHPPHAGHQSALIRAIDTLALQRAYVVPAGNPPHKKIETNRVDASVRYQLATLAFSNIPNVTMCDQEITRQGPSYTINTARAIKAKHPNDTIFLLMGTDMFQSLDSWYQIDELLKIVTPAVFSRGNTEDREITAFATHVKAKYQVDTTIIPHVAIAISSTELRESLLPNRHGADLLDPAVYSAIIQHRYYDARPSLAWLRGQAYAGLAEKRVRHTQSTEEAIVQLANRYGVDEEKAREAAILHDITKERDYEEQLRILQTYGIISSGEKAVQKKLLHATTGALLAKHQFGMDDDVTTAIARHTTGSPNMTMLDKILYIADYIESTRTFPGVDTLRKLAEENLDAAVLHGLKLTAEELEAKGVPSHPNTTEAIHWYENNQR